jgi:ubiquinone/menaquinone biosynthesis C-methylase UbiE
VRPSRELVRDARDRFNRELHTEEYDRIHSDESQLRTLIELLEVGPGKTVLDLGTGAGYVAFEIGRLCPGCEVVGIDIADVAIAANLEKKRKAGIANLDFRVYAGTALPFDDTSFDSVISRYAFHHFPDPRVSVAEISRVLRRGGLAVISDPVPLDGDTVGFIDEFQRLKPDGHVRFHRSAELDELFARHGLRRTGGFASQVCYPRPVDSRYQELLKRTPRTLLEQYRVQVAKAEISIAVDVANTVFRKE